MAKKWINIYPDKGSNIMLGLMPILLIFIVYFFASESRLEANPADKLLPSVQQMTQAFYRLAFENNPNTGEKLLWVDTGASLYRLLTGVLLSAVLALSLGVAMGAIPLLRSLLSPLVIIFALIPAMALLPILSIVFGIGELSKIVLIIIGLTPLMTRDVQQSIQAMPKELLIKAQTLGANSLQIILRVILPQALPRLFDITRLSLGAAWLFLIASESIAATEGLGYRIFLQQRYMAMDVILPLVAWISLLAFSLDRFLWLASKAFWPWYYRK